jgi:hypothetical protein
MGYFCHLLVAYFNIVPFSLLTVHLIVIMLLHFCMLHNSIIVMDDSSYIISMWMHHLQKMKNGDSVMTTIGENVNSTLRVTSFLHHGCAFHFRSKKSVFWLPLVMCMGNPWVVMRIPVPIPMETHTHSHEWVFDRSAIILPMGMMGTNPWWVYQGTQ